MHSFTALEGGTQEMSRCRSRRFIVVLGVSLLIGAATSCSSPPPAREYSVPSVLCGAKVSGESLEQLLPGGKQISAQPTSSVGAERCRLRVDGKVVFSVSVEKRAANTTARDVAMTAIGVEPTDTTTADGRFIYSRTGAVGRVECPGSTTGADKSWWATARTSHPADAAAMHHFIQAYTVSVASTRICDKS